MTAAAERRRDGSRRATAPRGRRAAWVALAILLVAVGLGIRVSTYSPLGPADPPEPAVRTPLGWAWRGAVEVHSRRSDGSGTVDEIVAAAREAGLDFVVLTDHAEDLLDEEPLPGGWHGDVLLAVAEEASTTGGHLLVLETAPRRYALAPEPVEALQDVRDLGGWAAIAHPRSDGGDPWTAGWGGFDGVETLNLSSAWYRAGPGRRLWSLASSLADPAYAAGVLVDAAPDVLSEYDRHTRLSSGPEVTRPMASLGALDSHGAVVSAGPLGFPGYRRTFGVLHAVVWMERPPGPDGGSEGAAGAIRALVGALREGRGATVVDALGRAPGFRFLARRPGDGKLVAPGGWAPWDRGPWILEATLGADDVGGPYRLVLVRDGEAVAGTDSAPLSLGIEAPGTYRIEAYRGDRVLGSGGAGPVPWIASNPIYVWPDDAWVGARPRPVPPLPLPPTGNVVGTGLWSAIAEGEAGSRLVEGPGGTTWRLEIGSGGGPERYAAVRWKPGRGDRVDWSDRRGIGVRLRAEVPLRAWIRVRTQPPGGEIRDWYASVKATAEGRETAVPWRRLRQSDGPTPEARDRDRGGDGAPGPEELRRIRAVYLVVTPAILRPGSAAGVRIEILGPY